MKSKFIYFLLVLYACLTDLPVVSKTYDLISDCHFNNLGENYGDDNITFICAEKEVRKDFNDNKFDCSNCHKLTNCQWPGSIDFQKCRFNVIHSKFFDEFTYLHTLIISDMQMETLPMETFRETNKLVRLVV